MSWQKMEFRQKSEICYGLSSPDLLLSSVKIEDSREGHKQSINRNAAGRSGIDLKLSEVKALYSL